MNQARAERKIVKERLSILHQLEDWLELPMVILGFVWLLLLVLELTTTWGSRFEILGTAIWIIFILDFMLKLAIAPDKLRYLRRSWLTMIALVIPALRVFRAVRAVRALRAVRGIRLVRVVSSINRAMKALGAVLGRRGFGHAVGLSLLVTLAGSAGMYAFERDHGLKDYGTALWWTAMIVTTMGSDYWPQTTEGRLLCLALAIYSFAVFGYVTAALASVFVGQDVTGGTKGNAGSTPALETEIAALRQDVTKLLLRTQTINPKE